MLFRLPIPPSSNNLFANANGKGRIRTKTYTKWLKEADAWYYLQRLNQQQPITGPIELHIRLPRIRGDASNRIKAAEDYLVSRKLTGDDKNNRKVTVEIDEGQDMRECWITVTGVPA